MQILGIQKQIGRGVGMGQSVWKVKKGAFAHEYNTLDQAGTLALNLCDPETVFKFHEVNSVLNSGEMVSKYLEPAESDMSDSLQNGNFDQVDSFRATGSSKSEEGKGGEEPCLCRLPLIFPRYIFLF